MKFIETLCKAFIKCQAVLPFYAIVKLMFFSSQFLSLLLCTSRCYRTCYYCMLLLSINIGQTGYTFLQFSFKHQLKQHLIRKTILFSSHSTVSLDRQFAEKFLFSQASIFSIIIIFVSHKSAFLP